MHYNDTKTYRTIKTLCWDRKTQGFPCYGNYQNPKVKHFFFLDYCNRAVNCLTTPKFHRKSKPPYL